MFVCLFAQAPNKHRITHTCHNPRPRVTIWPYTRSATPCLPCIRPTPQHSVCASQGVNLLPVHAPGFPPQLMHPSTPENPDPKHSARSYNVPTTNAGQRPELCPSWVSKHVSRPLVMQARNPTYNPLKPCQRKGWTSLIVLPCIHCHNRPQHVNAARALQQSFHKHYL